MRSSSTAGSTRSQSVAAEISPYLQDTAPQRGGRNARPLAIPALVRTYCDGRRTVRGLLAALLGAAGGGAFWYVLARAAQPEPPTALLGACAAIGSAMLVVAFMIGHRLIVQGKELIAGLRRWHEVAPEVPVHGADTLTTGPGLSRMVLACIGVLSGVGVLVGAVVTGTTASRVGGGVGAASLIGTGTVAALGWWRVRAVLRRAAPQHEAEAFAPPQAPAQQAPWMPPPVQAPRSWAPPPSPVPSEQPAQPWTPQVANEHDLGDTRMAADTAAARGASPVVALADGRRLRPGTTTLIGRAPEPRHDESMMASAAVEHPTVSKTHAAIRVSDDGVWVTDRSSTNGTTVVDVDGGRRRLDPWVEQRVPVGGEILLGSYRLRVPPGS